MTGGSIIRSPCDSASVPSVRRAPHLQETAGSRQNRPIPFSAFLPPVSRSQIHALSTTTTRCSGSTPPLCDEDSSPVKLEEGLKMSAQTGALYSVPSIFDSVPSKEEAEAAVSELNLVSLPYTQFVRDEAITSFKASAKDAFDSTSSAHGNLARTSASCVDQSKPGDLAYASKSLLSQAQNSVLNALHLLRINPSVQSMVVSLSTDKAVWNAVMKNEKVLEFRNTYRADEFLKYAENATHGSRPSDDLTARIISFLFETAKGKVMQFIEDIVRLVSKLFLSNYKDNTMDVVFDLVRSSFMISVLVFFVVILKRIE